MWLSTVAFEMLSAPSSTENIVGLAIIIAIFACSVKTRCFTNINIKKPWTK